MGNREPIFFKLPKNIENVEQRQNKVSRKCQKFISRLNMSRYAVAAIPVFLQLWALQCSAVRGSEGQVVQCSILKCGAKQKSAAQCNSAQFSSVQCNAVQSSVVQWFCSVPRVAPIHFLSPPFQHRIWGLEIMWEQNSAVYCSVCSGSVV